MYVPSLDGRCVMLLEADTLEPIGYIPLGADAAFSPKRIAASPDGAYIYVASEVRIPTAVVVLNAVTHAVVGEFRAGCLPVGNAPCTGLAVSPDGQTLYALSSNDNGLLVGDTRTLTLTRCAQIPGPGDVGSLHGIELTADGQTAYVVTFSGAVYVVNLATLAVTASVQTGVQGACDVTLGPNGDRLYVSGQSDFSPMSHT